MMADARRTNGEQDPQTIKEDMTSGQQGLEERPRKRTAGGRKADKRQQHKADARRTRIEDAAKAKNARGTRGGHMGETWLTSGGQGLEARLKPTPKADARRTSGGQGLEAQPKLTTQGGQVADKRRTSGEQVGGAAKANNTRRTGGGHMADKLRRPGQSISRPAFFLERETNSKLFGE